MAPHRVSCEVVAAAVRPRTTGPGADTSPLPLSLQERGSSRFQGPKQFKENRPGMDRAGNAGNGRAVHVADPHANGVAGTETDSPGIAVAIRGAGLIGQPVPGRAGRRGKTCEDIAHLPGRHRIEVIDVLVDFEAALHAHIMVAPTLLMVSPRPVTLFGALTDEERCRPPMWRGTRARATPTAPSPC